VQPGAPAHPLFGLADGNLINPDGAYDGNYNDFGTRNDPMVGQRVGGTITFGGGLALNSRGEPVGGLGLSGDTACADHSTAWRLRVNLRLAPPVPNDTMTLNDTSGHPHCPNDRGTQGATP
jgi:Haem-degrading